MNQTMSLNVPSMFSFNLMNIFKSKAFKVAIFTTLAVLCTSLAFAGGDDGALGEIWQSMLEALTGAPGKALSAAMLLSAAYFSVLKPNPGLAVVSFVMMMILANGEKIISGFLDAGIPL